MLVRKNIDFLTEDVNMIFTRYIGTNSLAVDL